MSSGNVEWYIRSYGRDLNNSERASPVVEVSLSAPARTIRLSCAEFGSPTWTRLQFRDGCLSRKEQTGRLVERLTGLRKTCESASNSLRTRATYLTLVRGTGGRVICHSTC